MSIIDNKYYLGYEGEKEIQFITKKRTMILWEGFFDDIMEQFKPSSNGWSGLPYYYHLAIGWYDESPWKISDLKGCLHQFTNLDITNCRFEESHTILTEICGMLSEAIQEDNDVWISSNWNVNNE